MLKQILWGAIILTILLIIISIFLPGQTPATQIQAEKNNEINCEEASQIDLCKLEKVYSAPSSLPYGLTATGREVSEKITNKEIPILPIIEDITDKNKKDNYRIFILTYLLQGNLTYQELTQLDNALQKSLPTDNDEFQKNAPTILVDRYRYSSFKSMGILTTFEEMLLSEKNDSTASGILNALRRAQIDDTKQQEIVMKFISNYDYLVENLPETMVWAVQLMYPLHPNETSQQITKICSGDFAKYVTTDAIMNNRYNLCKNSNTQIFKLCPIDKDEQVIDLDDAQSRAANCLPTLQSTIQF